MEFPSEEVVLLLLRLFGENCSMAASSDESWFSTKSKKPVLRTAGS